MPASPYSSNVILAKARAMYGRCLTAQDFHNLLACHSVSEIASYLKNRTAYAGVLADINESTIHRGHLESLLRRKLWNVPSGIKKKSPFLPVYSFPSMVIAHSPSTI